MKKGAAKERRQERREGKRNEGKNSPCRFPRSFCLLRFLSRRKMKLLLYQSPFPFPPSSFSLRPANEHPSLARSLPFPFVTCFSLPVFSSIHPLLLLHWPFRACQRSNALTRLSSSSQGGEPSPPPPPPSLTPPCTHPRRLLGYLRFLQRLRTEFSSSSSCLILALSVLQSLSCPPRISLPPCRQIKFLEERRKDHLPFFRPSGNLKPVPLYQKKLLPSPPTAATTTITTTLLQDPIAPSVFQPILALLALANKLGRAWGWNDYLDLRDDYVTTARLKSERALY